MDDLAAWENLNGSIGFNWVPKPWFTAREPPPFTFTNSTGFSSVQGQTPNDQYISIHFHMKPMNWGAKKGEPDILRRVDEVGDFLPCNSNHP